MRRCKWPRVLVLVLEKPTDKHTYTSTYYAQRSSIPLAGTYYRFDEELVVPIIENTPFEQDLEARLPSAPLCPLSR